MLFGERQMGAKDAVVTLTDAEVALSQKIGRQRNDEDDAAGLSKGGAFLGFDGSGYEQHILGVAGEIAFARFIGVDYVPSPMKAVDVGEYEVRTASRDGYRLIIRPRDADDKKFVSVVRCGERSYRVQGWITAGEAKGVGDRKNPQKGASAGPAWFVPTHKLHSFFPEDAPEEPTRASGWDQETLDNIAWFKGAKLPLEGFSLFSGITVANTDLFRKALEADIEQGPSGIRSRMGALQGELRRLRELFQSNSP